LIHSGLKRNKKRKCQISYHWQSSRGTAGSAGSWRQSITFSNVPTMNARISVFQCKIGKNARQYNRVRCCKCFQNVVGKFHSSHHDDSSEGLIKFRI
jgi:hypothetical protein